MRDTLEIYINLCFTPFQGIMIDFKRNCHAKNINISISRPSNERDSMNLLSSLNESVTVRWILTLVSMAKHLTKEARQFKNADIASVCLLIISTRRSDHMPTTFSSVAALHTFEGLEAPQNLRSLCIILLHAIRNFITFRFLSLLQVFPSSDKFSSWEHATVTVHPSGDSQGFP